MTPFLHLVGRTRFDARVAGTTTSQTGSLAPAPQNPERWQPVPDPPATVLAPTRPAQQERLIARIARRGAVPQSGSIPCWPAQRRLTSGRQTEGPYPSGIVLESAFRTTGGRNSAPPPPDVRRTAGMRPTCDSGPNSCRHADAPALDDGDPSANEGDRSTGSCRRERTALKHAGLERLLRRCGIRRAVPMQSCERRSGGLRAWHPDRDPRPGSVPLPWHCHVTGWSPVAGIGVCEGQARCLTAPLHNSRQALSHALRRPVQAGWRAPAARDFHPSGHVCTFRRLLDPPTCHALARGLA